MWATLRPLSVSSARFRGDSVLSVVLFEPDSPGSGEDGSVRMVETQVMRGIVAPNKFGIFPKTKLVVEEWLSYITYYILKQAISGAMCVNNSGKRIIRLADIIQSINILPSQIYLEGLGYSLHEATIVRKAKMEAGCDLEILLSPYLLEAGMCCSIKEFTGKCWSSYKDIRDLECCYISSEGKMYLSDWIERILSLIMHKGYHRRDFTMTVQDMMWAMKWMKNNDLYISLPLQNVQEPINTCNEQGMENKKITNMKTNSTASDGKFLPFLPLNLLESHVFTRFPYDELVRMKSVCKDWANSITSTCFESLRRRKQDRQMPYFLMFEASAFEEMSKKTQKCDGIELFTLDLAYNFHHSASLYDSCCGFLCLTWKNEINRIFCIGNPLTGEWVTLPPPTFPFELPKFYPGPGLAVDLCSHPPRYTLAILAIDENNHHLFNIFSSETWEWKTSNAQLPQNQSNWHTLERKGNSVYEKGVLYWTTGRFKHNLFWLDLINDEAGFIPIPTYTCPCFAAAIGSFGQYVTYSITVGNRSTSSAKNFYGVDIYALCCKNRWKKILTVDVYGHSIIPFPYCGGELLLVYNDGRIVGYNTRTSKSRVIVEACGSDYSFRNLCRYRMTLTPLPGKGEEAN